MLKYIANLGSESQAAESEICSTHKKPVKRKARRVFYDV
jgi:hypothetical protein